MERIALLARSRPLPFALIYTFVALAASQIPLPAEGGVWALAVVRIALAAMTFALIARIAGRQECAPCARAIGTTFILSAYLVVVVAAINLYALFGSAAAWAPASQWGPQLLATLALCLGVGFFEEGLFRGVFLNGLLSKTGSTFGGVVSAVLVSSLLFGVAHVVPSFLDGGVVGALGIAQALLKTLQAGTLGFFFSCVYLRTRSLWGVSLIHALHDFIPLGCSTLLNGTIEGTYIATGPTALALVAVYLGYLALYIPLVVESVWLLRGVAVPCPVPLGGDSNSRRS